ncbi:MAG: T9SS type A sorting domain-containing protein [bacterium]
MDILFLLIVWSPPVNLGILGIDDINPQACRIELFRPSCLVWQAYINGDWEIFSRIINYTIWSDTFRVSNHQGPDEHPTVAYDHIRNSFWCCWEYDSAGNYEIYIARWDSIMGWSPPERLTYDTLQDRLPQVAVISDTVWVVWEKEFMLGDSIWFNIYSRFYDGVNWSQEIPLATSGEVNIRPKINSRYDHPFAVWEKDGDIYYSEYLNNLWQTPQPITATNANELFPEIAVFKYPSGFNTYGVWVTWMGDSTGNYEIYSTGYDSLSYHYLITNNDSIDATPSPLFCTFITKRGGPSCTAFSTRRNGNEDIYICFGGYGGGYTEPVDLNPATDINPVMTETGWIWVLWQTNRNGDWDIYGSFISHGEIKEAHPPGTINGKSSLLVYPNPFRENTNITFQIPESGKRKFDFYHPLSVKIYNADGRLVGEFNQILRSGTFEFGEKLSSGVYFIELRYGNSSITKMVVKL